MNVHQFLISLVFRADTQGAKADAAEMRKEISGVSAEASKATGAVDRHAAALDRDAAAADRASKSYRELSEAQSRAHEETARAAGVPVSGSGAGPLDPALDRMRARWVPLYGAQRGYETGVDGIEKAWKSGAISMDEAHDAIIRLQSQYDRTAARIASADEALRGHTDTLGAATRGAAELGRAKGGLGVTLAGIVGPASVSGSVLTRRPNSARVVSWNRSVSRNCG